MNLRPANPPTLTKEMIQDHDVNVAAALAAMQMAMLKHRDEHLPALALAPELCTPSFGSTKAPQSA